MVNSEWVWGNCELMKIFYFRYTMRLTKYLGIPVVCILTCCTGSFMAEKFNVTKTRFESSREQYDIKIAVLAIDSMCADNKPSKYTLKVIYCTRQKGYHLNYRFKGDSMITDTLQGSIKYDFEFKPQKKIKFFEPNKYYDWSKVSGIYTYDYQGRYHILPFRFENGKWYLIEFVEASTAYTILFTLTPNGKIRQFHYHIPGPW